MKPQVLPEALAELSESIAYYENERPGLGAQFLTAVATTIELAAENPPLGAPLPLPAAGIRKFVVRRLPFVVLVAESGDTTKVVGITHASRRPGYWLDRLR